MYIVGGWSFCLLHIIFSKVSTRAPSIKSTFQAAEEEGGESITTTTCFEEPSQESPTVTSHWLNVIMVCSTEIQERQGNVGFIPGGMCPAYKEWRGDGYVETPAVCTAPSCWDVGVTMAGIISPLAVLSHRAWAASELQQVQRAVEIQSEAIPDGSQAPWRQEPCFSCSLLIPSA